ncbi:hypothetical protein GWI33_001012 [Rhynchophorus ferrugineus]|uniref:Uncharacterized protein n=1 Tax=Rhynchophorus ferrugineus TaxID=354439 RepID=A0A834IM74_RHYFE|nr:hypothetical protein GWI33_001012 [Rhynchophorus ferrugineus]
MKYATEGPSLVSPTLQRFDLEQSKFAGISVQHIRFRKYVAGILIGHGLIGIPYWQRPDDKYLGNVRVFLRGPNQVPAGGSRNPIGRQFRGEVT